MRRVGNGPGVLLVLGLSATVVARCLDAGARGTRAGAGPGGLRHQVTLRELPRRRCLRDGLSGQAGRRKVEKALLESKALEV